MRRFVVVLLVAGLAAAACSDDGGSTTDVDDSAPAPSTDVDDATSDDAPSDDAPSDDAPADDPDPTDEVPTGPAPGVSDDAIKIGITYVDLEPVRDFVDLDHGDYEAAYRALIDDINENGGIHGRMLDPVLAAVSPLGTTDADETCILMAQDEQVFVVIGAHRGDSVLCYLEVEGTAVIGGEMTEDRLARASAPWFSPAASSDVDLDALATFAANGSLDGPVAVFGVGGSEALFDDTMTELADLGVEPVASGILDADSDDLNAQNTATEVILENFRAAGAETVLIVGPGVVSWANGARESSYRPRLLTANASTANSVVSDGENQDLTILSGALLAGLYGPNVDRYAEPSMRECIAIVEAAGVEIPDPATISPADEQNPFVSARNACVNMALFVAIAEAAGPDLNYGSFRHAGENLGEVTIPGYPDPFVYGPPPSADGDPTVYLFEFDDEAAEFVRLG